MKSEKWDLKKIPKIANMYWGAKTLPFLRFLTIYSFCILNPDWKVFLYLPRKLSKKTMWSTEHNKFLIEKETQNNFFGKLKILKNLCISSFDMQNIGFSNDLPEVFKSDILRFFLLKEVGGIWVDTDIVFFKPISKVSFNEEKNKNINSFVCCQEYNKNYIINIGFLMSTPNSFFFNQSFNLIKEIKNPNEYEIFGSKTIRKFFDEKRIKSLIDNKEIFNMPENIVYPFRDIIDLFIEPIKSFPEETIGIHWFGGNEDIARFVDRISPKTYKKYNNCVCNAIKLFMKGEGNQCLKKF